MKDFKLYKVGGCVRDSILGVGSKDIDFSVVYSGELKDTEGVFNLLCESLSIEGYRIFQIREDCFTIRAKFPPNHTESGVDADFVLARKETYPNPSSRIPVVEIGTLKDDLERRDFTINAIAVDIEDGSLIDPFGGVEDLMFKYLECPIDPLISMMDDPLRVIRALRFSLTKGMKISPKLMVSFGNPEVWEKFKVVVSKERIASELDKMFSFDTVGTIKLIREVEEATGIDVMSMFFNSGLSLTTSMKKYKKINK